MCTMVLLITIYQLSFSNGDHCVRGCHRFSMIATRCVMCFKTQTNTWLISIIKLDTWLHCFRSLEDELATSKRTLQQQVADLEFSKSTIERQRDVLAGDLQAAQQDIAGLKSNVASLQSTIGSLTTANAGTKAELDVTQVSRRLYLDVNVVTSYIHETG